MTTPGPAPMPHARPGPTGPVQVTGEVLSVKRAGDFFHLTLVAGDIPERSRPGSFVGLAVGDPASSVLLRRPFWVHRVRPSGAYGGTVEILLRVRGGGTRVLSELRRHDEVDVVGPLGRPFALPKEPVSCVLVGGGHGCAPLFFLAERLRERGCGVHMVLGAEAERRLFGALEARRTAKSVTVTTTDGSVGITGSVTDPLGDLLERTGSAVVYACGPTAMLAAVASIASERAVWSQCAVEQPMACGTGLCMTCAIPAVGDDGVLRMPRACVEGPVLRGDQVQWESL
ncbi:MAG TPA: dihydroorotate dehydrogenase electron transfer subunit [Nocardioidaceae bacterium]|nr:dihydroorotate dehydrogenase electron transfer subunit [Nocardioidaceae bacterium]